MSGIVGILNLDGAPVDGALLEQMTRFLRYRGPDAQETWREGAVGFGHAMLRATREAEREEQPASLDGRVWITADARLDAREDLVAELRVRGRDVPDSAPDVELILHAYHAWDEECVEHLRGDFVFAIWDGGTRRLFCARDHFGVKLFYYACVDNCLVFSNTLNCVRLHSGVSEELNDQAIADFLLFGFNQDPATTSFADIARLPPAHVLTCADGVSRVRRYWSLPIESPLRYRRAVDYVDEFQELLGRAVQDRLRTDRVGIFMSGGLDSSTVAATCRKIIAGQRQAVDLRTFNVVYDRLIPDRERAYSRLVAKALDIPLEHLVADDYKLFQPAEPPEARWPEPCEYPLMAIEVDRFRQVAGHSRAVLTGEGGDPCFSCSLTTHFSRLAKAREWRRAATDFAQYWKAEGRLSRLYLRRRLDILFVKKRWRRVFPSWLSPDLERRLDLEERWRQINSQPEPAHQFRPHAYAALVSPYFQWVLEGYDPGNTYSPVEARHPFFDLRVVRFLLALPVVPWCTDKMLLREAMRGILPERVRLRPKTPQAGDPVVELLRRAEARWLDTLEPVPALRYYVNPSRLPRVTAERQYDRLWMTLRAISLNLWLQTLNPVRYKARKEAEYELRGA